MRPASITIPTLDGWRAVAILMVTAFHTCANMWNSSDPKAASIAQLGALGVDIFFGLSGLLITKLLLEEQERYGAISLRAFYLRRGFRVLVPCYCFIAVAVVFSLVESRTELLSSIFFFRNYLDTGSHDSYTTHLWSLSVEEHFYLLWPPILVAVTVKRGREVATWMAVGCALWRIALEQNFPALANFAFAHFRTDFRLDSLLWGAVAAFGLHQNQGTLKKALTPVAWSGLLAAFLICVGFYSRLTRLLMPMLIPLLLAGTLLHPEWRLSRILESRPMVWIGRHSYSLYLWQMLFLVPWTDSPHWWQHAPWNVMLSLAVATLSYNWLERPLRRVGKHLSDQVSRSGLKGRFQAVEV